MAEVQLIYTQEARLDVSEITDMHLRMVGVVSAQKALDALLDHIDKLSVFPRLGEEHPDERLRALGFRKLVHGNHIIVYRIESEACVVIVRIVWASSDYPELLTH